MQRQSASPSFLNLSNAYNLDERVKKLEEHVFKKVKRLTGTKSQKLLLFKDLGLLDKINELNLSQKKKAMLLSVLIDEDKDNIEDDLSQIFLKDSKLQNESNYKFLVKLYEDLGLEKFAKTSER